MRPKPPEWTDRLPSVSQLLEKPPVRVLSERVSRSTLVAGLRSFLEDVRHELGQRRGDQTLPRIGELAELAAQYVLGREDAGGGPVINATGCLLSSQWDLVPLSEGAAAALAGTARKFGRARTAARANPAHDPPGHALRRATGAEAAAVVHSYEGAVWLIAAALASGKPVAVARSQLMQFSGGSSLASLVAQSGASLREVGHSNGARIEDYQHALQAPAGMVLWARSDCCRMVGQVEQIDRQQLMQLAHDRGWIYAELLDAASPTRQSVEQIDWLESPPADDAAQRLATGVDLVALRGDGLLGGPPCGILLGRQAPIEQIAAHPTFPAWQLDRLRQAALQHSLRSQRDSTADSAETTAPVIRLLRTPAENLRHRAHRLAEQLSEASSIAVCEPVALISTIAQNADPEFQVRSHGIALSPVDGDVARLAERLQQADRPIIGRVEKDRLLLDLRSVLPEQDTEMASTVLDTENQAAKAGAVHRSHHAPQDVADKVAIMLRRM